MFLMEEKTCRFKQGVRWKHNLMNYTRAASCQHKARYITKQCPRNNVPAMHCNQGQTDQ